jgi:hypothetical protein
MKICGELHCCFVPHTCSTCFTLHATLTCSTTPLSTPPHLRLRRRGVDSRTRGHDQSKHIVIDAFSSLSSDAFTPFHHCDRARPMSSASRIIRILTLDVRSHPLSCMPACSRLTPYPPISFEVLIFGLPLMVHPVVGGSMRTKQIEDQANAPGTTR